jgi:hypothetical protein
MNALAIKNLPEGKEWFYEVKFDGYRCFAVRRRFQTFAAPTVAALRSLAYSRHKALRGSHMDVWAIGTAALTSIGSIIASVITGVIAGRFGVRTALRQFTMQRGFDRRLEWYEGTTQAVIHFRELNETLAFALQNNRVDLLEFARENTFNLTKEFQKNVNTSLLYADREIYLRLKEVGAKLRETTDTTSKLLQTGQRPTAMYESNAKLLEQTIFELSKPIREMLGLDELTLADFKK